MAKRNAAEKPEAPEVTEAYVPASPVEGESREDMIVRMIPKVVASCGEDMKPGEVFGRVLERLQHWGATDEELSGNIAFIRKTADEHCAQRDAKAADIAATRAAREAIAIGKSLS